MTTYIDERWLMNDGETIAAAVRDAVAEFAGEHGEEQEGYTRRDSWWSFEGFTLGLRLDRVHAAKAEDDTDLVYDLGEPEGSLPEPFDGRWQSTLVGVEREGGHAWAIYEIEGE